VKTVLLLQENQAAMNQFAAALSDKGYKVFEATTAAQAISQFISNGRKLHLLIADVRLPASSGLHIARLFRAECPRLQAILTAHYPRSLWTGEETEDLVRLGIDSASILVQPFSVATIVNATEAAIGLPEIERRSVIARLA
jgi:DNA-binding response OmpR family regulator